MKIEIQDLKYVYPTGDHALRGISTVIDGSESVAIIGQNGSGKTTLVKHFNGILRPTSGTVLIDNEDINNRTTAQWAKKVGYVFQNPDDQLFLDSVRKELAFGPRQIGFSDAEIEENVRYAAELCQIDDKLEKHPFDLNSTDKKFCTIAAIIAMNPDILVFDEPTMGQDIEGSKRLSNIIHQQKTLGKLCITISHDMKFVVKNFERIIVLCQGEILLDGDRETVLSQPEILKKSFVTPPPVTRVGQAASLNATVFTVEALVNSVNEKRGNAA